MNKRGFAVILVVLAIFLVAIIGFSLFFIGRNIKPPEIIKQLTSIETEWGGIIATDKGFLKINPQGTLEKDSNSQAKIFQPPGINVDNDPKYEAADHLIFRGLYAFSDDGRIIFVGSPNVVSAPKRNTIYSWSIDTTDDPVPLLEIEEGRKIQALVASPDNKQVAIISVLLTGRDLYKNLDKLYPGSSQEELTKIFEEGEKQLQEDLRTISIYNLKTGKAVNLLKLNEPSPSREGRSRPAKLLWNKTGLFVIEPTDPHIFNPQTGESIVTIAPVGSFEVISPDGSKYYDRRRSVVRKTTDNELVAKLYAPEFISEEQVDENADLEKQIVWVGPAAFSPDSTRVIVSGEGAYKTNFMIWELDTETGKTIKIGDLNILPYEDVSKPETRKRLGMSFSLHELFYHPLGDQILFVLEIFENPHLKGAYRSGYFPETNLFQLKRGENKAEDLGLLPSRESSHVDPESISFLGWYKSSSKR